MSRLLSAVVVLVSLGILPACTTSHHVSSTKPEQTTLEQPKTEKNASAEQIPPVMVFERTPCYGMCPHYTARLYADGRVEYEGFRHAPVEGKRTAQIAPSVVQNLLRQADLLGFQKLDNMYSSGVTDLPTTALSIRYPDGTTKAVRAESGAPVELRNLFATLNTEIEKALGVTAER
ncbi:DUF6438 domain-containing protein [Hymenobacter sp. AT01-02]|uniref:DUF6438 domain-containing protein n=1 Tax=Hymenobacter sp. AT01-02 TaxID=1571877 RepID=UPI0005F1DDA7|nr:DUF6438 domain-containing protein [Hymenobacter sp. AT01-02]